MAPKRGTKQAKIVNNEEYKNLALSDALCPICRYILVLPVTLPCNHNFCGACFEGTVANANLTCPLCRVRFASWLRIAKKEDRLVNGKLWMEIQTKFSDKVRNRQEGVEEVLTEAPEIKLTSAGEIRREYEEQLRRDREELERQRQAEEAASAELIRKLKEQDALELAQQEKLKQEEARENTLKKRPLDKLIQNMQKHLNVIPSKHATHADVQLLQNSMEIPQPHKLNDCVASTSGSGSSSGPSGSGKDGPVPEKSTKQKNLMHFTEVIEISDSNDSIENECRYFKPIDYRNIPPSSAGTSPLKVPAVFKNNLTFKFEPPNKSNPTLNFTDGISAFVRFTTNSRKRKLSDKVIMKKTESDLPSTASATSSSKAPHTMTLRDRKPSNSSSSPPHLPPHLTTATLLNGFKLTSTAAANSRETRVEFNKLEQERSDLEFAKKLQEEFNRERYSTRSSISCRNNIKKPRQLTLTEIMSTSKCK